MPVSLRRFVYATAAITESLNTVGGNIGRLSSISTLGSVAGTMLIGYVLIPHLSNSVIMYGTAVILMLTGAVYFLAFDGRDKRLVAAGVVLIAGAGAADYAAARQVRPRRCTSLYQANSNFGELQVLDDPSNMSRYFLNDFLVQNTYDTVERKSRSAFSYVLHDLAWAYAPGIGRALCIGMGMGIVPGRLAGEGVSVDVVEINPALPAMARNYFDCDTDRFNLVIGDGRCYINRAAADTYDVVVLDAFLGDSIPSHLFSSEAFASIKRILKPEGVLLINSFGSFAEGRDFAMASLEQTLRDGAGFRSVKVHACGDGNVFFVASGQAQLKILRWPDFEDVSPVCRSRVEELFSNLHPTDASHGMILRDDFNPLEYQDAAKREATRRRLAQSMQNY